MAALRDERATLRGRVGRFARVGAAVGGTAARLAGNRYLGLDLDRDRHASELKAALGGLKGPLMKAAQILATIPDALPAEYAAELAQLQANAPPMGWPFVKRRMAAELGPDWRARFATFERAAARAASAPQCAAPGPFPPPSGRKGRTRRAAAICGRSPQYAGRKIVTNLGVTDGRNRERPATSIAGPGGI